MKLLSFTYPCAYFAVPPLSVMLMPDRKKPFSAGKEATIECRCRGSRPTPIFRWYVGDAELDMGLGKMTIEHHRQEKGREEWISSVIKYVPKPDDNGKYLVCRATNEYFPNNVKEDGYIINVHCKCTLS